MQLVHYDVFNFMVIGWNKQLFIADLFANNLLSIHRIKKIVLAIGVDSKPRIEDIKSGRKNIKTSYLGQLNKPALVGAQ